MICIYFGHGDWRRRLNLKRMVENSGNDVFFVFNLFKRLNDSSCRPSLREIKIYLLSLGLVIVSLVHST